jgi:hypothetical protein
MQFFDKPLTATSFVEVDEQNLHVLRKDRRHFPAVPGSDVGVARFIALPWSTRSHKVSSYS